MPNLTVAVTDQTATALQTAAETTGDTRTDTLNRAVQLYAQLVQAVASGSSVLLTGPDQSGRTSELAALRRIVAEHVHATLTTAAGPARRVLANRVVRPLVAALDAAGIDLTPELTAIGVTLPAQRGTEAGHDDTEADRG